MGGGVGLTIGFIFGSYSILRYEYDPSHCTKEMNTMIPFGKVGSWTKRVPCYVIPVYA